MNARLKCLSGCRQCAQLFRLGRDVEAALTMVDVIDEAQAMVLSASQDVQQSWTCVLTKMLACQERQDWLGLADFLEYELLELLESVPA
ncbi:hypothetical protein [Pseudomonas moorei]|jgi:hypothetical protein|uniref:Uncharacterized protein n=1 Tax=Pseudomonas moorei TaxID=395599 RepID=A0A1H1HBI6_9PSED|nr:hypothetical protein [Pseudomonas moorei]KAB0506561.1 hypothetical protein F7R06_08060 [Pseudomonas moorei]SDR22416.1 hypothetical protein SAMN04490195_3940 [Pseudomonas moorei]